MTSFEEAYAGVPDAVADPTNLWGLRQSELVQAAQLRATSAMDSAKVAVLTSGTPVWLLQRETLVATGQQRVRVRTATGATGWLTSKMVSAPAPLDARAFARASGACEFAAGVTDDGVAFLRTRLGLCLADAPVLVVLHGTSYNAGVWIPTMEALDDAARAAGVGYEAWLVEWTGHGRSRPCPPGGGDPDIGVDRYDLAERGPSDVASVLASPGAAAAVAAGRPVFAVAHSVGAQICCHAELKRPGTFGGIVAIEPILVPSRGVGRGGLDLTGLIRGTLAKRATWEGESDTVVRDYLAKTAMGRQWEPRAVDAFVAHGVVRAARRAGARATWALRCDPVTEAAIYANSAVSAGRAFDRLGEIKCPGFVCVGHDSTMNATTSALHRDNGRAVAARFGRPLVGELADLVEPDRTEYHGACVVLKKADHYIPMENARWCAAFVAAALARFRSDEFRDLPYYATKPKPLA